MFKEMQDLIDSVTKNADKLSGLSATGIWSLFCVVLIAVIWYDKKEAYRKDMDDRKIREAKSVTESKTADALFKLGDAYERLADTTKTAIDIALRR